MPLQSCALGAINTSVVRNVTVVGDPDHREASVRDPPFRMRGASCAEFSLRFLTLDPGATLARLSEYLDGKLAPESCERMRRNIEALSRGRGLHRRSEAGD